MHSSITPARIPPVMTIVPADIRPALHQTLQRSDAGLEQEGGRRGPRGMEIQSDGEGKMSKKKVHQLVFVVVFSLLLVVTEEASDMCCRMFSVLVHKKGFYTDSQCRRN